ncbi:MAG: Ig-like domain-containing protein, partial [Propionibacteriaceae bacterium]|nr:Ig-like domain-containing protein [Propionibacteriaceae bacterium]
DVLDEGYYADTTIKAGKDDIGADGFGPNVSASIYNVGTSSSPFWRGRVTLAATDSRAQYTLLSEDSMDRWVPVSASGALLSHDSADSAAYWRTGTGAALSFNGLDPGRQFRVVVRPAGYTELDWATLAADTSTPAVLVTVPQPGQEVTADMVARESQSASDKVFLTGVDAAGSYHLLDATTGKQLWSGTGNTSYTITLDGCGAATSVCGHALQAVAEVSGTFTAGVRVYPYPEFAQQALAIDYVGESIGLGAGNVPAGIEFQVDYQGENLITVPDTADGYRAASGSARLQLGAATSYTAGPLLDAITTGTATLRYRLARAAGYDGEYVAPASQLAIPARPEGDADSADVDWAAETFDGQSFASYGYSGLSAIDIPISQPAVAGEKFRSKVVNFTINARPAAPTGLGADYTGGVFTVSGLLDGVDYEYSTDRSTWTAISAVADGKAALGSASVYYVRFAAVPASHNPASLATRASDYPLSVDNVSFGEQVYGYGALAAAAVTVANKAGSSTEGTDRTTTLSIEGQLKDGQPFAEGAFEIDGPASLELPVLVPGSAVDSGYRVKAKEGLPAGAYTATLVLGYDGGSGPATAAADITFAVTKATWASPTLEAQVGVLGDDISVTLTEPLPDGEAAEYSLDHSAWQDSGDFPGLGWATQYELWARVKADANHFASASVLLEPKIFTAYQQPVWDDVLRLNYAAETVEFLPGAVSTDYQISSGGQPVAANAGLGFLLDGAGGDLTLVRVGADDPRNGPIDSEGASVQLNPRSAAPDSGDLSTTPAATATQPTGTIVHSLGKAFEYRLHGSSGAWTQAVGGTATAVAYGDYDVRFPATDSAFASRAAEVAVGALYLEYAITWSDPLEEGLATGSELDVEEVGAGPIGQHAKVAGGHDVAFTLAADSLDAWFRATLNTGAPGEPDLVQTADGHLSPGRVEFRFTTTVNSELSATSKVEAFAKRAAVFDANGGSGSPAATGNTLADPDYQVSLPDGAGLRRPGYVFTGWNTAADGTGFAYAAGDRYELDADCASQPLYAQWAATAGELLRAAGQAVSVSGGSGTASDPFTVPAVFPNDVAQLRAADLAVSPGAAATVSHTQDYQPDDAVPLTAGAATDVFAVVTPEAGGTWHYVIKAFRLAASSSLAELLDALGGLRASGALQAYTDESVQALDDAMAAADALLAGTPTQAQVDAASQAVLAAVEGLRAKTVPAPLPTPTPAPQPGPDPTPSPSPVPGPAVPVAGIAIAGAPAQAAYKQGGKGNRIQLSATVTPADASDKTLRWSSSNSALASVDASGLVTLHDGEGTVVITAAAADGSGVRDTQQLKVVRNVTAVRTPLLKLYLRRGTTYKLPVAVDDSTQMAKHISSAVTYKSSNSKVLQVDAHGKLTTSAKVSKTTKVYLDVLAANGKKLRVSVYVVPKAKALGGVKLAIPKKATMKVGKAFVLKLKGTKSATNVLPRFKSSKPSVISVGKAGKLVALKKGKSTITVKIGGKTIKRTIRVQ